jgi:4,5-DOPA dioxygenase extradiol
MNVMVESTKIIPAVFFGHGNPMNALSHNAYTQKWRQLGMQFPKPRAILSISAHWFVSGTAVTISTAPRTIHDFKGFPEELYRVQYPAPGDPELAERVKQLLAPIAVSLDESWGLDHGTWSVLCHLYPDANIPVVQLSLNASEPAAWHFDMGRRLAPLREEGVLLAGSGNMVHNLRAYGWGRQQIDAYDWAIRFEAEAKQLMLAEDTKPLIDYQRLGQDAALSIPTPEHYLPLLYVLGARQGGEPIAFPVTGVDGGSISMLAVQVGGDQR